MKLLAKRRFSMGRKGTAMRCCTSKMSLFLASAQEWCSFSACRQRCLSDKNPAPHNWQITGAWIIGNCALECSAAPACSIVARAKWGISGDATSVAGVYAGFFRHRSRRSLISTRFGGSRWRWLRNQAIFCNCSELMGANVSARSCFITKSKNAVAMTSADAVGIRLLEVIVPPCCNCSEAISPRCDAGVFDA